LSESHSHFVFHRLTRASGLAILAIEEREC
jgi:hypothetical protein